VGNELEEKLERDLEGAGVDERGVALHLAERVHVAVEELGDRVLVGGRGVGHLVRVLVGADDVADLLVEDALVVELKRADHFTSEHTAQCLNYLRASGRTVCLLIDFQRPKVEWKRIVSGFGLPNPFDDSLATAEI